MRIQDIGKAVTLQDRITEIDRKRAAFDKVLATQQSVTLGLHTPAQSASIEALPPEALAAISAILFNALLSEREAVVSEIEAL